MTTSLIDETSHDTLNSSSNLLQNNTNNNNKNTDNNTNTQFNNDNLESHDILDEFLDQRVYDSLGSNTPHNFQFKTEASNHDNLLDSLYTLTNDDGKTFQNNFTNQITPNNDDYFYLDINQDLHPSTQSSNDIKNFNHQTPPPQQQFQQQQQNQPQSNISFSPNSVISPYQKQFSDFDVVREELSKLKFGSHHMKSVPDSINVPDPSYLDFSEKSMNALPYKLSLSSLPSYSRVETQIKCNLVLNPAPTQMLLHIPQNLISKNKFCLSEPIETLNPKLKENLLYLDAFVLTSDLKKSCNICSRCIKREQKRASRGKNTDVEESVNKSNGAVKNNPNTWANENMMKKAVIFNCKEIVSFPSPTGLNNDVTKSLELSARIICYCRHHKESEGFKLLLVVKNYQGEVVAKQISSPIMIMDRKKNLSKDPSATNLTTFKKKQSSDSERSPQDIQQLSPNSVDESASQTNTDIELNSNRGLKRKKLSTDDSFTNPMNGYSPVSNSDTNISIHNNNIKPLQFQQQQSQQQNSPQQNSPSIQRIIPAQGPIRGGIEVTLLGFNFRPGLSVKFGAHQALATHCWSDTTIVTYLPPSTHAGQVLVSFENHESLMMGGQQQIFTYTDDTERQLIELALQIVGLKMNGKLEDAKNIAKRIVGSDKNSGSQQTSPNHQSANEWFDNAHKSLKQLTTSDLSTQDILINLLSLVDLPNCPIIIPNWQLTNKQGQTLLHLATLKSYTKLIRFLITRGCKIDLKDNQGITPLFLASMCGYRDLIKIFIDCKSNWNLKLSNDKYLKDYCDLNVLDMFENFKEVQEEEAHQSSEEESIEVKKSLSLDSLNSMFDINYGRHVSKMVQEDELQEEIQDYSSSDEHSSEFADSEFESEDDYEEEEADYNQDEIQEVNEVSITPPQSPPGLWQKMKNVFNNEEDTDVLPTYDDLFPFGPSQGKPKSQIEQRINTEQQQIEDQGIQSDSSEDMVVTYINHPRKTVENDKMLFFFWVPSLVLIMALFFMIYIMGYQFQQIDKIKDLIRGFVGNLMVGNERIGKVFNNNIKA
ncbi:unnamed protein product [Candida verbasci]|uniref:IPT/TIG domain-containing protein n=1 Tax=Candida verbasci TaxID=1227364 RepID=A0A9W4XH91_9ASCO|nr:unnamed protein product [Candida verbasci]